MMASAVFSSLCVALWVTGLILSSKVAVSFGDQALDCCLTSSNQVIPKSIAISYQEQRKDKGCSIDAVIFKTKKGKHLCAPANSQWVIDLKTWLDQQLKKCQQNNYKGKRCQATKSA